LSFAPVFFLLVSCCLFGFINLPQIRQRKSLEKFLLALFLYGIFLFFLSRFLLSLSNFWHWICYAGGRKIKKDSRRWRRWRICSSQCSFAWLIFSATATLGFIFIFAGYVIYFFFLEKKAMCLWNNWCANVENSIEFTLSESGGAKWESR